jgi:chaperonin GroES
MTLKPIGPRIVVQYKKLEQKKGALIIPNEEQPQFATVIEDTPESMEFGIYKDDLVGIYRHAGMAFKVENETYLVIEIKDIIAKLEPKNET